MCKHSVAPGKYVISCCLHADVELCSYQLSEYNATDVKSVDVLNLKEEIYILTVLRKIDEVQQHVTNLKSAPLIFVTPLSCVFMCLLDCQTLSL